MENKSKLPGIIMVVVLILAAVMFFMAENPFKKSEKTETETQQQESQDETPVEQAETEESDNSDEEEFQDETIYTELPYTDNDYPDESACLSPDDYEMYYGDGFSFGYPKYLFNYGYANDEEGYYELTYQDEYYMTLQVTETDFNAQNTVNRTYEEYMSDFDETYFNRAVGDIDSKGFARALIGGYYYPSRHGQYVIIASDGSRKYVLTFEYPETDVNDEYKEINYIVDCVYRYCSFSGGTYKPRSWKQFLVDDMGTKK